MTALRKPAPSRMTVDEFLSWNPRSGSGLRWQLVDGEPVAMAPAGEQHGALQGELARLIGNHLADRRSGCRVIVEPGVIPRVRSNRNVRIPDLAVTCAPPSIAPTLAEPVVLIEIISPSNEAETRANIWTYITLPSVQEVLAIQSTRIEAELLRRDADGTWPAEPVMLRGGDTLELDSIGLSIPLAELYRTTTLAAPPP